MIILIDSGNSRLKVGWLDPSSPDMPREPAAVAFDGLDLDALDRWLAALPQRPSRALGVNVAGAERGAAIAATLQRHGCAAVSYTHLVQTTRQAWTWNTFTTGARGVAV